jgi:hypothetical protein
MATWVDMYDKGDVVATWQYYLSLVKEHRDTLSQPNVTLWVLERATHMLAQQKGNYDDIHLASRNCGSSGYNDQDENTH